MRAVTALLVAFVAIGPAEMWASQASPAGEAEIKALKQMASAVPLGSRVKAQTNNGKRITGTLMTVTDEAVMIKKNTRIPEPAVTLPFADLARLELQTAEGMNAGKIVGLGLAAGAGAILTLFAFFAALGGD